MGKSKLLVKTQSILKVSCFSFLFLHVVSCGTKKNTTVPVVKSISKTDYPYIEKFHEGLRLKSKGELDNSLACFNYCLTVRQNDDAVYYALSRLYAEKKDLLKSLESLQNASKFAPDNIWYTQELAYQYFDQNNFEESVKCFSKLVEKEPTNVDWLYGYAECLVKVGKASEAIKALDKTEEQVGKHPELTIQKFKLYVQLKQPEKGIAEINKSRLVFPKDPQLLGVLIDYYFQTNQEKKAIEILKDLSIIDPTNGRAHMFLAEVYNQQLNKKEFYSELKKGFVCDDVDIDSKMKVLISISENPAKLAPEAVELADILVKQYPSDSKAYAIQGDFYLRGEQNEKAFDSYKNALKFDKTKYAIWNQVLIMEYQSSKFNLLYEDSKVCLELFPSIPSVYLLNGIGANQLNKFSEAITVLEAGKDLIINDKSLLSEFKSQLGEAFFGNKQYKEGIVKFEEALAIDPLSTITMNNYAYRLALAKIDFQTAEELIKKANATSPNQPHFLDTYGFVLFQKGDYVKAKEYFEKAYALNSTDKIIIEHMGDIYFKTGQKEKAVEFWIKAKEAGSMNKNINQKIDKKEFYEPMY